LNLRLFDPLEFFDEKLNKDYPLKINIGKAGFLTLMKILTSAD